MKNILLPSLGITALLSLASCKKEIRSQSDTAIVTDSIHYELLTIDTHCDINTANFTSEVNYTTELNTQVDLPKMEKGGLDAAWFIVFTPQESLDEEGYDRAYERAMDKFKAIHRLTDSLAPEEIGLATTPSEVKALWSQGKKIAIIGIENGYPIGTDLNRVQEFFDLGGRYMSLAHQGHSQLSDSNTGEANGEWLHNGLSDLGKQVISEMNRVGMIIDVSHPSKEAIRQMIELSKAPVMASHSSARALCDHSRNLDDDQLTWIKNNGGVVQTVAFSAYVNQEKHQKYTQVRDSLMTAMGATLVSRDSLRQWSDSLRTAYYESFRKYRAMAEETLQNHNDLASPVDVSDYVDHIDYLVKKIGIEHVGISSDFDGGGGVFGWNDASETPAVTRELIKRGYSKEDLEKLWGGNLLRVWEEVEKVAAELQKAS